MFDAAAMATVLEEDVPVSIKDRGKHSLTKLRAEGAGFRFPWPEEGKATSPGEPQ